jgi:hypothetical protein
MDPFTLYNLAGLASKAYNYFNQPSQPARPVAPPPQLAAPRYAGPVIPGTSVDTFRSTGQDGPYSGILGVQTRAGQGGPSGLPPANTNNNAGNEVDLAQRVNDNTMRQIRDRFNQTKSEAESIRSQGMQTFNDLINSVKAFRTRAGDQYANAGQEITNRGSELLGSNARTAQETLGTSRALGRALGLGDSSKFNQQNRVIAGLGSMQGSTLARQGEQEASNRGVYDARLGQADDNEAEANRYRTGIENAASQLERQGLDTYGGDVGAASNAFGQSLNSIIEYQRNLANLNPLNAGGLTTYQPDFTGITNTLNGVTPTAGGTTGADAGGASNLEINPTLADYLRRRQGIYQR